MAEAKNEYAFVGVVFFDKPTKKKWISVRLPYEETKVGEKFIVRFRPKGKTDQEWRQATATVYFERFTDGHIIDIEMEFPGVNVDDEFDVIAKRIM